MIYKYRILLVGDRNTGKRTMLKLFKNGNRQFADFHSKNFEFDNNHPVKLEVLTKSTFEKNLLTNENLSNVAGIMFIYDKTSMNTFDTIRRFWDEFKGEMLFEIPILLIGNKNDLSSNVQQTKQAEKFAKEEKMKFIEISSKNNENVEVCLNNSTK